MSQQPTSRQEPIAGRKTSRRGLTRDAVVASICGFIVVLMVMLLQIPLVMLHDKIFPDQNAT